MKYIKWGYGYVSFLCAVLLVDYALFFLFEWDYFEVAATGWDVVAFSVMTSAWQYGLAVASFAVLSMMWRVRRNVSLRRLITWAFISGVVMEAGPVLLDQIQNGLSVYLGVFFIGTWLPSLLAGCILFLILPTHSREWSNVSNGVRYN